MYICDYGVVVDILNGMICDDPGVTERFGDGIYGSWKDDKDVWRFESGMCSGMEAIILFVENARGSGSQEGSKVKLQGLVF